MITVVTVLQEDRENNTDLIYIKGILLNENNVTMAADSLYSRNTWSTVKADQGMYRG